MLVKADVGEVEVDGELVVTAAKWKQVIQGDTGNFLFTCGSCSQHNSQSLHTFDLVKLPDVERPLTTMRCVYCRARNVFYVRWESYLAHEDK